MSNTKRNTKVTKKLTRNLIGKLNQIDVPEVDKETAQLQSTDSVTVSTNQEKGEGDKDYWHAVSNAVQALFQNVEGEEFTPQDYSTGIPIASLESNVGYSSLIRQMHHAFVERIAYYRSQAGGSLPIEEARRRAFHPATDEKEALRIFDKMLAQPLESLNFVDLMELQSYSPRTAEWFWERAKQEGRAEFESGHLAANITFPVGYMKELWNIARYLGIRESFIDDWKPTGGTEVALIDMLAQSYFQWQYWLEQTVKRSQTSEREEHPDYVKWKQSKSAQNKAEGWSDGHWLRPYVTEQAALDQAVQMADRFNRIFMRTLRQLRDLRRYSPVTINNPNQVNIATDGGQQVNVSNADVGKA